MAREERDQQRRAFGAEAADGTWIEALPEGPASAAKPLQDGAHMRLSRGQIVGLAIALLILLLLAAMRPHAMLQGFHLLFFVGFMSHSTIKLVAAFTPRAPTVSPPLPDEALPVYTIIAPLYREAAVAGELVANLARLDYPRDRLQVLIVLETEDHETQLAFASLDLPVGFQVLIAPPGSPRTKPRACNIALERAHGDLVVIYDAEDAPHPGQLREAAARFAEADAALACLQAPLRIEPDPRFLPDQFALEYAVLFEVFLPALARWGCPSRWAAQQSFPRRRPARRRRVGSLQCHRGRRHRLPPGRARLSVGRHSPTDPGDRAGRAEGLEAATRALDQGPSADPGRSGPRSRRPHPARPDRPCPDLGPAGHLLPPARPAVRLAAASMDRLDARPLRGRSGHGLDAAVLRLDLHRGGRGAGPAAGRTSAEIPALLGAVFYWPLQSLAAVEALRQFVVAPFHWDKTPHTPRAANPLLPRLLARTGRALP